MMVSKYKFKQAERHAVYTVHNEKCYICGSMLTMQTVQIDHIVPESLAKNLEALEKVCKELGLPDGFELNSYENWLPCCSRCNLEKLANVWKPSLQVQRAVERAADNAEKARLLESNLTSDRRVTRAISIVRTAVEGGTLTPEMIETLRPLIAFQTRNRNEEFAEEPIRFTPFLEVDRYRFNTIANEVSFRGTNDKVDLGNEFFIDGARLTKFLMKVIFKHVERTFRRDICLDVYVERPEYEPTTSSQLSDQIALLVLSSGRTAKCVVGGNEVTLQTYQQEADVLWVVVSSG